MKYRFHPLFYGGVALWPAFMWLTASVFAEQLQKMSLEQHIQQVIGPDPVDCGRIPWGPAATEATFQRAVACARGAVANHKAFRLVQWAQGVDSEVASGLLAARDGSILFFQWDSAPCGGPDCVERFLTNPCLLSKVTFTAFAPGYLQLSCLR
jgi:hypothetical protein